MSISSKIIFRDGFGDKSGIVFSWLCALHCLMAPLLTAVLPLVGLSFLGDEMSEYFLVGISVLVATFTLIPAFIKQHRKVRVFVFFAAGLSLLIMADELFAENIWAKLAIVVSGAGLITTAHLVNRRLCRECAVCCADKIRSSLV